MQILLATGLYPPAIGGTATYAKHLAEELQKKGHEVRVVTYSREVTSQKSQVTSITGKVENISSSGYFFQRWMRYAKAVRKYGADADVVIALSSVSVGIPLLIARLKKPKKILRLGGDFFWERYTDAGGMMGLREWYERSWGFWRIVNTLCMGFLLRSFDLLVYSTEFQRQIHERAFMRLPKRLVIENALPTFTPHPSSDAASSPNASPFQGEGKHVAHMPFRLLSMSRFVGFKNLEALVRAMLILKEKNMQLTMIGSGPRECALNNLVRSLALEDVVTFRLPVSAEEKQQAFQNHDLLVIPSTTDISPNTALEARAAHLPVLLTRETGLSPRLTSSMVLADLVLPVDIAKAVEDVQKRYDDVAHEANGTLLQYDWSDVALEWHTHLIALV